MANKPKCGNTTLFKWAERERGWLYATGGKNVVKTHKHMHRHINQLVINLSRFVKEELISKQHTNMALSLLF